MADNNNLTDNASEHESFPTDFTEYYYRCRISNIEAGAEDFYYIVNTILYNWKEIVKIENDSQVDLNNASKFHIITQLIKYNDDFYKISQKLIKKSDINTIDDYRKNLSLLICIINETMMLLSNYYTYINKKVRKINLISIDRNDNKEYKTYDSSCIPSALVLGNQNTNSKTKKIKFDKLVSRISEVSLTVRPNDFNAIINSFMFVLTVGVALILILFGSLLVLLVIVFKIERLFSLSGDNWRNFSTFIIALIAFFIALAFLKKCFPIFDNFERQNKTITQSKNYIIDPSNKKIKVNRLEMLKIVWKIIKEIISIWPNSGE